MCLRPVYFHAIPSYTFICFIQKLDKIGIMIYLCAYLLSVEDSNFVMTIFSSIYVSYTFFFFFFLQEYM